MSRTRGTGATNRAVIVVGAINVDLVVAAARLPGAGETVVGERLERYGGGKGANAAVAASRAGALVYLVGAVGADDHGRGALAELAAEGVAVTEVAMLDDEATGVALIVVDADGENQIAVAAGANGALSALHVTRALDHLLAHAGCVLVSTEIPGAAVVAAVEATSAAGVRCVLNPAPPSPEVAQLLRHQLILTPNASESIQLATMLGDVGGPDPTRAARVIHRHCGSPVVVTLGEQGALLLADGSETKVAPRQVQVRDTTGAGDTFNGVLAARLAAGEPVDQAVTAAGAAASLAVEHIGARTSMPMAAQIEAVLAAQCNG